MVIRTFRQTWKVVWKGKRDKHGRKIYEKVGKPTQEVAWHVTSLAPENIMSAMMVARSLGMWVCARSPGRSTEAVQRDLLRHPSKLMRIMTKGGLL